MARFPSKLTLLYTPESLEDLAEIWQWNAEQKGEPHANRYVTFLRAQTEKLANIENAGRPVATRDGYRYVTIRRRTRGYGHVAIFEIDGDLLY